MIKAIIERSDGEVTVNVEFEGSMTELLSDTTFLARAIAKDLEKQKPGYGRAYLDGLRMGMRLGLFSLELPEDPPAGPCPQGPEGEPGGLEEKENTGG
ncbi:MAG TPA: hypothetical protein IAA53_03125 [Candidatus Avoscillospira avicola]|uniref:Uncharacterized protein n=1 Tax=Candidatus Avoscillospira avicola TaxID=2840706 RepID=A0A9D1DGM8_9FIRM|nr:hypothetical protein [Candidatus Avoscillospira avicola]